MSAAIHVLTSGASSSREVASELAAAVLAGLSEFPKRISSRFFYDDVGSELFARLCEQPEYYPTRTERGILEAHREALCATVGDAPLVLVDLGAGDGRKTHLLLESLLARAPSLRYAPIDVSEGAVRDLVARTDARWPGLRVSALVGDYVDGLAWLGSQFPRERKLLLFLGSSIGNFRRAEACAFLWRLRQACVPGDRLLIGFDLKKDLDVMRQAYNDPAGVTAAFNRNLLVRINRELGADFQPERFCHFAAYNIDSGAVESSLISLEPQTVRVTALPATFSFAAWEPIHLEYSYKFRLSDVNELAAQAGFVVERHLFDEQRWFVDSLWRVDELPRA